jgi:hypothetical protein
MAAPTTNIPKTTADSEMTVLRASRNKYVPSTLQVPPDQANSGPSSNRIQRELLETDVDAIHDRGLSYP